MKAILFALILLCLTLIQTNGEEQECINSELFKLRHNECMRCTCNQLKRMANDFIKKMCRLNRWDMNPELPGTLKACCRVCKNAGVDVTAADCVLNLECPSREKYQGFCGYADLTFVGLASNDPDETDVVAATVTETERYIQFQTNAQYPAFLIVFDDTIYTTGSMCIEYRLKNLASVPLHVHIYMGDKDNFHQSHTIRSKTEEKTRHFNINSKTGHVPIKMLVNYPASLYQSDSTITTTFNNIHIKGCLCND